METDKYVTLISETYNNNNFDIFLVNYLTFGEGWEMALVQAFIPHRDSYFAEAFKAYFPNNKVVGVLTVHYNTNPTAPSPQLKHTSVRVDDIIDGMGKGTMKFDELLAPQDQPLVTPVVQTHSVHRMPSITNSAPDPVPKTTNSSTTNGSSILARSTRSHMVTAPKIIKTHFCYYTFCCSFTQNIQSFTSIVETITQIYMH